MPIEVGKSATIAADRVQDQHVVLLKELSEFDGATGWSSTAMWATAFFDAWGRDLGLGRGMLALKKSDVKIDGVDYRVLDVLRAQRDTTSLKGKHIDAGQFVAVLARRDAPAEP